MLSDTLEKGLKFYKIGPKIRALRLNKKLGLVQLGDHTGLSSAILSKIERGQIFPTLPTLLRIALVFGVGLDHFFRHDEQRKPAVIIRKKERLRFPAAPDAPQPPYFFESLDFPMTDRAVKGYYAEFPAETEASEHHQHSGTELIYVIKGELLVKVDGQDLVLEEGDAACFDSSAPHSYQQQGHTPCSVIVVVAP